MDVVDQAITGMFIKMIDGCPTACGQHLLFGAVKIELVSGKPHLHIQACPVDVAVVLGLGALKNRPFHF